MFKAVVGHGIDPDSMGAIEEALEQCQATLGNDIPQAGIVIAAIDFDHAKILTYIQQTYPNILLVGGTSVGEMSSAMAFQEDSLTLMLFCSDEVTFKVGMGQGVTTDAAAAAKGAIAQVTTHQDGSEIKLCYALSESLGLSDGAAIVSELQKATGKTVPIFGGLTADDWQFKKTYQFINDQVVEDAVVVLTFSGNLNVSCGVATGQHPVGPKALVTKATGNTILEINHQPASGFWREAYAENQFSPETLSRIGDSIAVYEDYERDNQNFYVRSRNGEGDTTGSLNFFGHVPEKATIQFTECTPDELLQAAQTAFERALADYPGNQPTTALIVSCAARLKNLGSQVNKECELAENFLGADIPLMGFYSYGEFSPFSGQSGGHFHNETFTAVLLGTE